MKSWNIERRNDFSAFIECKREHCTWTKGQFTVKTNVQRWLEHVFILGRSQNTRSYVQLFYFFPQSASFSLACFYFLSHSFVAFYIVFMVSLPILLTHTRRLRMNCVYFIVPAILFGFGCSLSCCYLQTLFFPLCLRYFPTKILKLCDFVTHSS